MVLKHTVLAAKVCMTNEMLNQKLVLASKHQGSKHTQFALYSASSKS